jgi:hypothetical protein
LALVSGLEAELEKSDAKAVRDLSLKAITDLTAALAVCKERGSQAEFDDMRKAVGHSIGHIESGILSVIYAEYPDLDDLK